ncbi:MAG: PAS domain S-box protein [bacterium]|nr:PAS domain S-box protein [bacterium]
MKDHKDKTKEQLLEELASLKHRNEELKAAEEGRKNVEEELRVLNEAASEGIMVHEKGILLKANHQYFKMFGYQPDELIDKQVLPLTVVPESLDFKTRRTTPDGVTTYEIDGLRKNGETFLMEVRGKLMEYRGRTVRGVAMMDITESKNVEIALRESEKMLRFLSSRLFLAHEEERSRLSKELHDQLGHDLVLLKSQLRSLCRKVDEARDDTFHQDFENTVAEIDRIIENVRRISRDLRPSILEDLGLFASLQKLVENFAKQHSITINLDMEDIDHLFSREAQINLYRMFQEILTNISKHSGAENVSVMIKKEDGDIAFYVEDDGKGFEFNKVMTRKFSEKGVGLTAMKERMNMLGGSFQVRSQPGKGTSIIFTVPIKEKEV